MIVIYGQYFDPNADSIEVLVGGKKLNSVATYVIYGLHTCTLVNSGIGTVHNWGKAIRNN